MKQGPQKLHKTPVSKGIEPDSHSKHNKHSSPQTHPRKDLASRAYKTMLFHKHPPKLLTLVGIIILIYKIMISSGREFKLKVKGPLTNEQFGEARSAIVKELKIEEKKVAHFLEATEGGGTLMIDFGEDGQRKAVDLCCTLIELGIIACVEQEGISSRGDQFRYGCAFTP